MGDNSQIAMIPRDKPQAITWDTEWVAMHTDFQFPEVTDVSFLAEFKKVMIEVAGNRMYDYRAAEQVEGCLVTSGIACPEMEKAAAAEGFTRYAKIKDYIRLQMDVLHGAAHKWQGHDAMQMEMWPAWMLQWTGVGGETDWRERWEKVGGKVFKPLIEGRDPDHGETGVIALKTDPVWERLGDPTIFPDALGIDHPPFYDGSWLTWSPVEKIEVIAIGLIAPDRSVETTKALVKLHIENKKAYADILDRSIRESAEEYERRNSPEALAAEAKEYAEWWAILNFTDTVVASVKKAVAASKHDQLITLGMRIRKALTHWKLAEKPRAKAALHRAMGHIEESSGRLEIAIIEYQAALNVDPKAGCQRDLKRVAKPET